MVEPQEVTEPATGVKRVTDNGWYQLMLGLATLVPAVALLAAAILEPGVWDWLSDAFKGYGWVLLLILVVALAWALTKVRSLRAAPPTAAPPAEARPIAAKTIGTRVPGGEAIVDYLTSTLFMGNRLQELRGSDIDHQLVSYEKNFRLDGHDIWTFERYEARNCSVQPTTSLQLPTIGGSSLGAEDLQTEAFQIVSGKQRGLSILAAEDRERFKLLKLQLATPLPSGKTTVVHYSELWPRAMKDGIDAVFYTQVLYYSRGIGELSSRLEFDRPLNAISAWWYDLDADVCEPDVNEIVERTGGSHDQPIFEWRVTNPLSSRLYFVVFDRPTR